MTDFYRDHGARLRNIIIFTIGGTKGIDILEKLTAEIREFWPEFEGFITVYYEGIFSTYQDNGCFRDQPSGRGFSTGRVVSLRLNSEERHFPCAALFLKNVSSTMVVQDVMRP